MEEGVGLGMGKGKGKGEGEISRCRRGKELDDVGVEGMD